MLTLTVRPSAGEQSGGEADVGEAAPGADPGDLFPLLAAAADPAVAVQEDAQDQQVRRPQYWGGLPEDGMRISGRFGNGYVQGRVQGKRKWTVAPLYYHNLPTHVLPPVDGESQASRMTLAFKWKCLE